MNTLIRLLGKTCEDRREGDRWKRHGFLFRLIMKVADCLQRSNSPITGALSRMMPFPSKVEIFI